MLTKLFSATYILTLLFVSSLVPLNAGDFQQETVGGFGAILALTLSSDGTKLAMGGSEGVINFVNANTLDLEDQIINQTSDMDYIYSLAFSPDDAKLAQASGDGIVIIWDIASHNRIMTLTGHSGAVFSVDWSSDGAKIISSSEDQTVNIWDAQTGSLLNTLTGHTSEVMSCAFSPGGNLITSVSRGGFGGAPAPEVKVWETATGTCLWTNNFEHTASIRSVVFSPDGSKIATGASDQTVRIWDVSTGTCLDTIPTQEYENFSICWSPDGSMIASGETWYQVAGEIWDANTGVLITALGSPPTQVIHPVYAVSFSLDNNYFFTAGNGWNLRKWEISTGSYVDSLIGHNNSLMDADWSPDGSKIVSAGADGTAMIWDTAGNWLRTIRHSLSEYVYVSCIDWSGDGTKIATGSSEHDVFLERDSIKIWDAETGVLLSVFDEPWEYIHSVVFSPNSDKLAAGCGYKDGSDYDIRIWDVGTGVLLGTMVGHTDVVRSVSWSPDGTKLASGSMDNTVRIWDTSSYSLINTLYGHTEQVAAVSWSQDGTKLASGGGDYFGSDFDIRIWDATTGVIIQTLVGHSFIVKSLSWFEKKVASASLDNSLKIWNGETGELIETLYGHLSGVNSVKWLDSSRLLSAGEDRTWRTWRDTVLVEIKEPHTTFHHPIALLNQINPNPFSRLTSICYQVSAMAHIKIRIYDGSGRLIRTLIDEKKSTGTYQISWGGKDNEDHPVSAGVYFVRLEAEDYKETEKVILLR